jgi:OmpA-OmpF porin, OOP family
MFNRRALAACCVLAIPYGACFAQTSYTADSYFDNRWYITPFGTYINADSNRQAQNGWGGGLSIGKPISPSWNIELRSQYEELDGRFGGPLSDGRYKNWSGSVDAQWFFMGRQGFRVWQSNSVQPYLVGGIGAIEDRISGPLFSESKTGFMANAGAGVVWPFSNWGRLVADIRYRYDDNNRNGVIFDQGHAHDWLFTVGLQIPFGAAPVVAHAPPPAPPVAMPAPPPPPPPAARNFEIKADGTFAFAKSDLTPAGRSRIDSTIQELRSSGIRLHSISIVGYTDPIGSLEFNQRLSVARANSVRDYLVAQGVPADIIHTEGRGPADLKITEAECRAQGKAKNRTALIACFEPNRRVEIHAEGEQPG